MADEFACTIEETPDAMCISCPEVPAADPVAAQTVVDPQLGWNTCARSTETQLGDCYTSFSVPQVVGVVCGFAKEYVSTHPRMITHGFYLFQQAGRGVYRIIENGVMKTGAAPRLSVTTDRYRIERTGTQVRYLVNDIEVYASSIPSEGELMVVACMYAAPDGVY